MKQITRNICLFVLILVNGSAYVAAQNREVELDLPEEYEFRVKKDTADADFVLTSYEAVNPGTGAAPFEIMVSSMKVSLMPKTMDEWMGSVAETVQRYSPSAKLETLREEGNKRLYFIQSGATGNSILILMYKTETRFFMIETEIPPRELLVVSQDRWSGIFWNAVAN